MTMLRSSRDRGQSTSLDERHGASVSDACDQTDDVVVARQPIVGMMHYDAEHVISELLGVELGGIGPLDLTERGLRRRASGRAVRYFLAERDGQGYWDFFKPYDALSVSVTDAIYHKDTWINVEGSGFFKVRLLLSGELRTESGVMLLGAPRAMVVVSPGPSREGYFIAAGQWTRMVVLHGGPEALTSVLGLDPREIPPPLDGLLIHNRTPDPLCVPFGPELLHAAQRIADSRHQMPPTLRGAYIDALSIEILTQLLADFSNQEMLRRTALSTRDLNRIYEARDYLAQHYNKPPSIPELARLVGTNQTKLKAGFRQATRLTIYDFVLKCRMERAAELLVPGGFSIREVAYRVGYQYPANFTYAFKKYHGRLPSTWIRGHGGTPTSPAPSRVF